jgi:hypothetical protein
VAARAIGFVERLATNEDVLRCQRSGELRKAASAPGRRLTLARLAAALRSSLPAPTATTAAASSRDLNESLVLGERSWSLGENEAAKHRTRQSNDTRQAILPIHKKVILRMCRPQQYVSRRRRRNLERQAAFGVPSLLPIGWT